MTRAESFRKSVVRVRGIVCGEGLADRESFRSSAASYNSPISRNCRSGSLCAGEFKGVFGVEVPKKFGGKKLGRVQFNSVPGLCGVCACSVCVCVVILGG